MFQENCYVRFESFLTTILLHLCLKTPIRTTKVTFYSTCSSTLQKTSKGKNGRLKNKEKWLHSLNMMDIFSSFLPHVGHVWGVGHRLAPKECILGHVERGAFRGDQNNRWTWWEAHGSSHETFSDILCFRHLLAWKITLGSSNLGHHVLLNYIISTVQCILNVREEEQWKLKLTTQRWLKQFKGQDQVNALEL